MCSRGKERQGAENRSWHSLLSMYRTVKQGIEISLVTEKSLREAIIKDSYYQFTQGIIQFQEHDSEVEISFVRLDGVRGTFTETIRLYSKQKSLEHIP